MYVCGLKEGVYIKVCESGLFVILSSGIEDFLLTHIPSWSCYSASNVDFIFSL